MNATEQRRVVTGRGMFQNLMTEIRRRRAEYLRGDRKSWKRGTCFVEMRTLPQMNLYHRDKTVNVGIIKSGPNKGKPKMQGVPNPFFDFIHRDDDGDPKPTILHVSRCRASIFFDYQKKVQDAQERNGLERTFEAGPKAWEWEHFKIDGEYMPFAWKVDRDKEGNIIEKPVSERKIYLRILPEWVKRNEDGTVRKDEKGDSVKYVENESWYEDIATGQRLTDEQYKILTDFLKKTDDQAVADAQGHGNIEDIVKPLSPNILNVTYLAALGKRYRFPQRNFGPISPTDFERLEILVEDDDLTTEEDTVEFGPVKVPAILPKSPTKTTV